MGWLIPKPTPPKKITLKIVFFDPNFTFRFPKSHKNPGLGRWENKFGKAFPKKRFYFCGAPLKEKLCTESVNAVWALIVFRKWRQRAPCAIFSTSLIHSFRHCWNFVFVSSPAIKSLPEITLWGFLAAAACLSINLGLHHFDRGRACLLSHGKGSELFWI